MSREAVRSLPCAMPACATARTHGVQLVCTAARLPDGPLLPSQDENAHSVGGRQELFTLSSMLK